MTQHAHRTRSIEHSSLRALNADGQPMHLPYWLASDDSWKHRTGESGIVVIVVDSSNSVPVGVIARLKKAATILVLGPCDRRKWREEALAAGAFGCFSAATPAEDRVGLLVAAMQYQSARSEIRGLRAHCDRICFDLVKGFGSAMEKAAGARKEARDVREVLANIRMRVLRALV